MLAAGLLAGCGGTDSGTAVPGIVATTTVTSTQPGTTVTGPATTYSVISTAVTSVTVPTTVTRPTTVTITKESTPAPGAGWTHRPNSDGVGAETFPSGLPGWTMSNNWQSGPVALPNLFTPAAGPDGDRFPSTMNGCDSQRFLILWHVKDVQIKAIWWDDTGASQNPVTGTSGWFDLDSCETPAFQALPGGASADVSVDVQQYVRAG